MTSDTAPRADSPTAPAAGTAGRLETLHPGWFAAVMGTGILAVATYENPGGVDALTDSMHAIGTALAVLAYLLAAVLSVAFVTRGVRHRRAVAADLRHPVMGALYGTVPGGVLVLAVMTSVVAPSWLPGGVLTALIGTFAVTGALLAVVVSLAFSYALVLGETPPPTANGGWLIPPVVTIIVPLAFAAWATRVDAETAQLLVVGGYAFYGTGLLLFLFVTSVLYVRLVHQPLPPAHMAPSLWIVLGPLGVGALSLIALARAGSALFGDSSGAVTSISILMATGLWGFGLWWLALVAALLVRYARNGGVPFSLGWWAFTFPLGAFTVATMTLARLWDSGVVDALSVALYAGLVGFWLIVARGTLKGVRSGAIWARG